MGSSVAGLGDVNGDGIDDVVIGSRQSDSPTRTNNGEAFVVFGRTGAGGILAKSTLSNGTGGFVIRGQANNDQLGDAVTRAGDVNDDGLNDIIVGLPRGNANGNNSGGAAVVFGKSSGTVVEVSTLTNGVGGWVAFGVAAGDLAGTAVSGGQDVNGDGGADVVVGANLGDKVGVGPINNTGAAYVLFDSTRNSALQLSTINAGTGNGFSIFGAVANENSGIAVSLTGDMNGDGLAEIVVGASAANASRGHTYVIFGKSSTTPVQASNIINGTGGFVIFGTAPDDLSGLFVSRVGDMNGDGRADLIVGAPQNDAGGPNRGNSYVVFGKSTTTSIVAANILGSVGFQIRGEADGDQSGFSAASIGDVNGDGIQDAIVGAHLNDINGTSSGRAYVFYSPITPPASGTYLSRTGAGNPQNTPLGGLDNAGNPDSRVSVNYGAGSTAGLTTGILNRNKTGITGLEISKVASVFWELTTTVTFSDARVTFNYLDSELVGIQEDQLRIYKSPDANGPWTPVPGTILNMARNTISGDVTSFSHFVLVDSTVLSVKLSEFTATTTGSGVDVTWTTDSETDSVGFFIRRANADGTPGARVSETITPAVGGGTYTVSDPSGEAQTVYLLEEITVNGETIYYGPVGGNARNSNVSEWSNF